MLQSTNVGLHFKYYLIKMENRKWTQLRAHTNASVFFERRTSLISCEFDKMPTESRRRVRFVLKMQSMLFAVQLEANGREKRRAHTYYMSKDDTGNIITDEDIISSTEANTNWMEIEKLPHKKWVDTCAAALQRRHVAATFHKISERVTSYWGHGRLLVHSFSYENATMLMVFVVICRVANSFANDFRNLFFSLSSVSDAIYTLNQSECTPFKRLNTAW